MVPLMLQRLHKLQEEAQEERQLATNNRPFAHFGQDRNSGGDGENKGVPGKRKVIRISCNIIIFSNIYFKNIKYHEYYNIIN